mmetsp:Transcript_83812/g.233790  ORF Transcript_83812/g.233790 Transcript_83812/m.233790 type:complete len:594 (+) Transcript_83812:124-1905(+)
MHSSISQGPSSLSEPRRRRRGPPEPRCDRRCGGGNRLRSLMLVSLLPVGIEASTWRLMFSNSKTTCAGTGDDYLGSHNTISTGEACKAACDSDPECSAIFFITANVGWKRCQMFRYCASVRTAYKVGNTYTKNDGRIPVSSGRACAYLTEFEEASCSYCNRYYDGRSTTGPYAFDTWCQYVPSKSACHEKRLATSNGWEVETGCATTTTTTALTPLDVPETKFAPVPHYLVVRVGTCEDAGMDTVMDIDECQLAGARLTSNPHVAFPDDQPASGYAATGKDQPRGCALESAYYPGLVSSAKPLFYPKATGSCGAGARFCICRTSVVFKWSLHRTAWDCEASQTGPGGHTLDSCLKHCKDYKFMAWWSHGADTCRCYSSCENGQRVSSGTMNVVYEKTTNPLFDATPSDTVHTSLLLTVAQRMQAKVQDLTAKLRLSQSQMQQLGHTVGQIGHDLTRASQDFAAKDAAVREGYQAVQDVQREAADLAPKTAHLRSTVSKLESLARKTEAALSNIKPLVTQLEVPRRVTDAEERLRKIVMKGNLTPVFEDLRAYEEGVQSAVNKSLSAEAGLVDPLLHAHRASIRKLHHVHARVR